MKERINEFQLFSLIVLFEIGSTTLFALGIDAKQDAWIAILLGMFFGLILLWVYTELQKSFPTKNLVEIIIVLVGKTIGYPLAFLYALYFIHISTHNLNEFGNLAIITFLPETPFVVVVSIFMFIVLYALFSGIEVLGRISVIMIIIVLFFLINMYSLIGISGYIDLKKLTPILSNGIKPVLGAAYPQVVNFPFGEMIVFLMYWPYVNKEKAIRKVSFLAVGMSGILLMISLIIIVSVLGVDAASRSNIPLLEVVRRINIRDVIMHVDAIAIVNMVIGGFFKMTISFYGGILGMITLFKIKDKRRILILGAIFTMYITIVTIPSFPFQRWLGQKVTTPYIHVPFQIIFPVLLLMINYFKRKMSLVNEDDKNV
ncbi:GerAB/ArcD/ProY family transporter [Crassaminicella profunda]|uniref:GerAB/ArcD/ProY family transporter n=1 Tax=Crassaminicella profunda TaxID=1286698 RepID=UPI001CA61CB1|nr:GerAB/ArcD/ProY family transporter [Crassaminicella profunda]QZY54173.1 spore germination protein [Crassaminicella profunda]